MVMLHRPLHVKQVRFYYANELFAQGEGFEPPSHGFGIRLVRHYVPAYTRCFRSDTFYNALVEDG